MCAVNAHPGTPPQCLDHLQRMSMPTPGALALQPTPAKEQCAPKILPRWLLQCIHSIHSSERHVSKFSVRQIAPKRHKTLLEAQLLTWTVGPRSCGVTGGKVSPHSEQRERKSPSRNPSHRVYSVWSRFSRQSQLFPTCFLGPLMLKIREPSLSPCLFQRTRRVR